MTVAVREKSEAKQRRPTTAFPEPSAAEIAIPSLSDCAEWREATAKLEELTAKLSRTERRITEIHGMDSTQTAEWLRERAMEVIETGAAPTDIRKQLQQELQDLHYAARVYKEAIEVQKPKVDQARGKFSKEACARLRGHHRELVQAVARALAALSEANDAEQEFLERIQGNGLVVVNLPVGSFSCIGSKRDVSGLIASFMFDLEAQGHLNGDEPFLIELKRLHGRPV